MIITSGSCKGRRVKTVKTNDVRPTSSKIRESIFNILQSSIAGAVMLDLFAGSGIVGLEAFSRGAKKVVFVEKNSKVFKVLKENIANFDLEHELIFSDAILALDRLGKESFDIIFIDPPYAMEDLIDSALTKIRQNNLLSKDGIVIIEHGPSYDFKKAKESSCFTVLKEKKYGDTCITMLTI